MPTEQQIQKKILDYIKDLDRCWAVKTINTNKNGTPDIIGVIEGRFFGLEVKAPGNKPSPLQLYQIDQIQQSGGIAGVVYSVDDVKELLC